MKKQEEEIRRLARRYGVAECYQNIRGELIQVPLETLAFFVERLQEEEGLFPPVVVSKGRQIFLSGPTEEGELTILNEHQEEVACYRFTGPRILLRLPDDAPWGYYQVFLALPRMSCTILWVFSPFRCYLPSEKLWGINTALYSLLTKRNQGIGDVRDLEMLARVVHEKGGRFLGLLPLYLLGKESQASFSPYFPADRLSLEPLYLPIEEIAQQFAEFHLPYDECVFQEVRESPEIRYWEVWQKKDRFLRQLFDAFFERRNTATKQWEVFQRFVENRGERLLFASFFQAFAEQEGLDWTKWPEAIRTCHKESVKREIARNEKAVLYYAFLQWLMEQKIEEIGKRFPVLGFDLPIGSSPRGIESWIEQKKMIFECSIGSPPDDFSPQGQNWGVSPFNPWKERRDWYRHFIELLRFNFRLAKFLRIDHIMGLHRLFLIPQGASAKEGTYVRSFFAETLAILALESYRNKVTIIGEDLGTVPNAVRRAMEKARILSTKVFYFEKDGNWPRHPSSYPLLSFTTPNTHDMPTFLGFLEGNDIHIRERLGIFTKEEGERQRQTREAFIENLFKLWQEWGGGEEYPLWERLARFLALTPSLLVAMSLDDILESAMQPNLPGTTTEFPNWRHRLIIPEDLPQRIEKLAQIFQARH
ncbi:MAG: 4-alpha-glucanotransferase [Candidatus Atribacteria bacterium]|nr:4-alpha-glucanotransferase [Candidatus Atribacteria bacterium]